MRFKSVFILLFLTGCSSSVESDVGSNLDPGWFNLTSYVEAQSEALQAVSIAKTVDVNGAKEAREIASVNWMEELSPFAQSDIDRPALWDKYQVDTLIDSDLRRVRVTYTALDSSLFTKKVVVGYKGSVTNLEAVEEVEIFNSLSSTIANTQQRLHIYNGGYSVESLQSARLMEDRTLSILATW